MSSREELQMREAVEAWGRARWPGCRVMHELQIGGCRIDLAFVQESHIAGVEIKSSRDTLKRLDRQLYFFVGGLPEVWLAIAPKWIEQTHSLRRLVHHPMIDDGLVHSVGRIVVDNGRVEETIKRGTWAGPDSAAVDELCTNALLHLLLKPELLAICRRHNIPIRSRTRGLGCPQTGRQRPDGEIRSLRKCAASCAAARPGWVADPVIREAA